MREGMGLYKAKRKDDGKWIQGYLFCIWEKAYILWGTINGIPDMVEVDPDTVCEWTGLVDKNGVNVFEGDIVESIFTKKPYIVCFGEYKCINEYDEEKYEYGWYNVDEGWFRTAFARPDEWGIVIGNIHDKEVQE